FGGVSAGTTLGINTTCPGSVFGTGDCNLLAIEATTVGGAVSSVFNVSAALASYPVIGFGTSSPALANSGGGMVAIGGGSSGFTADLYTSGGLGIGNATTSDGDLAIGDDFFFYNNRRFGIGTTSPGAMLAIDAPASGSSPRNLIYLATTTLNHTRAPLIQFGTTTQSYSANTAGTHEGGTLIGANIDCGRQLGAFSIANCTPLALEVHGIPAFHVTQGSFLDPGGGSGGGIYTTVGIGTSSPSFSSSLNGVFGVAGDAYIAGGLGVGNATSSDGEFVVGSTALGRMNNFAVFNNGRVSIGSSTPQATLAIDVRGGAAQRNALYIATSTLNHVRGAPLVQIGNSVANNYYSWSTFGGVSAGTTLGINTTCPGTVGGSGDCNLLAIEATAGSGVVSSMFNVSAALASYPVIGFGTSSPALANSSGGMVAIGGGSSGITADLYVSGGLGVGNATTSDGDLAIGDDFFFYNNGRIGVGTTTPQNRLTAQSGTFVMENYQDPTVIGGVETNTAVNDITSAGQYLFVAADSVASTCSGTTITGCELRIYDRSNPKTLVAVGGVDVGAQDLTSVVVAGRYAYITSSSASQGFRVVDVYAPGSSTVVATVNTGAATNDVYVSGRYAYVGVNTNAGANEVFIYDISNPTAPVSIGGIELGRDVMTLAVQENYLYVGLGSSAGDTEVQVYDISNPLAITAVGTGYEAGAVIRDIQVVGQYAYVTTNERSGVGDLSYEFVILDVSNPASALSVVGGVNTDANARANKVKVLGRYAYITLESNTGNELRVYNILNRANVISVGGYEAGAAMRGLYVIGRHAYFGTSAIVGNELNVVSTAGIDAPGGTFGSLFADQFDISGNARVFNDLHVGGGITIGSGGINAFGPVGITGTTTIMSVFATGTTTPILTGLGDISVGGGTSGLTADAYFSGGLGIGNATTVDGTLEVYNSIYIDAGSTNSQDSLVLAGGIPDTAGNANVSKFRIGSPISGGAAYGTAIGVNITCTLSNTCGLADLQANSTSIFKVADAYSGFSTSSPWGLLSIEQTTGQSKNHPLFVIGDVGTGASTSPFVYVTQKGVISFGSSSPSNVLNKPGDLVIGSSTAAANTTQDFSDMFIMGGIGVGNATTADGWINADNIYLTSYTESGTEALCKVNNSTTGSVINDCSGAPVLDYAELYATSPDVTYGDIVVIGSSTVAVKGLDPVEVKVLEDPTLAHHEVQLVKSTKPYSVNIIGVASNNYGDFSSTGHGRIAPEDHPLPVALVGRVAVHVSTENGPIAAGDKITSSHLAGVGMKATQSGGIVGTALSVFDGSVGTTTIIDIEDPETGVIEHREVVLGEVIVFMDPGWTHLDTELVNATSSGPMWLVDQETGRTVSGLALDMNGQGIYNIKELASASGNWSLDEEGRLVVREIKTGAIEVGKAEQPNGVTLFDTAGGAPYCVYVKEGAVQTISGRCEDNISVLRGLDTQGGSPSDGGGETSQDPPVEGGDDQITPPSEDPPPQNAPGDGLGAEDPPPDTQGDDLSAEPPPGSLEPPTV
ncbi:MAG: hypothetical protein AAB372_02740, partial [Patescibacteria group bacterium]